LFAELPGARLDYPGEGTFFLYGGHRLWRAPEVKALTYVPDNDPVRIEPFENGCIVTQPTEPRTGLKKSLRIRLDPDSPVVEVHHRIENGGAVAVEIAPWAITQLRPGGVAILPQLVGAGDPDGVLPNRGIHLWPYTDIGSRYLHLGNRYILLDVSMQATDSPFKVGFPNPRGWLGYWLEGTLFVKETPFDPAARYPDMGSSSEVYFNHAFVELESLGGLRRVEPGESVQLDETWRIFGDVPEPLDEDACDKIVTSFGLV